MKLRFTFLQHKFDECLPDKMKNESNGICVFQGGIRGVVWTDAFQLVVVWAGLLCIMFKAASDLGGWATVWEISRQGDRLPKFK